MNITNRPSTKFARIARISRRSGRAKAAIVCAIAPIAGILMPARAGVQLTGVSNGAASLSQNGAITNIRTSNNAILNFSQFNVAAGSTVDFIQPSTASRELNQINSAAPSLINGAIVSNGSVYFVNPAGVIFGNGSSVNVNQIVVAGSHMSNQDFLAGIDHFTGVSGQVSNAGTINANSAVLIGSQVINTGSIVAPGGMVAMLSGSDVLVSQAGSHITAKVVPTAAPSATAGGSGSGTTPKDISTSALAAGDPYTLAIRHSGVIQASNVLINGGGGQVQVSGSVNASSTAAGATGGTVAITGGEVDLLAADINVSGPAGGGIVNIGGGSRGSGDLPHADTVYLDGNTVINADATANGDGGSVVLWSGGSTISSALLTARGGPLGGNGGSIETSGETLQVTRAPIASAPQGAMGTWLLDPLNVTIVNGADQGTATLSGATVTNGTINAALGNENVTITTNQSGGDPGTLTQDSGAPITVSLSTSATLTFQANSTIDLSGGITSTGAALNVEIDELGASGTQVSVDTSAIAINGTLKILGGSFDLNSGSLSATSININTATVTTVGALPVSNGSVMLAAPVSVTTAAGFAAGGTASFTSNGNGAITVANGPVTITNTGLDTIGEPVSTGGGAFSATGGTQIITSGTGTITTGAGSVTMTSNGAIDIGNAITTTGGGVNITGQSLSIGGAVTSGSSSVTAGGNVILTSTQGVTTSATINTDGGSLTINSQGAVTISGNITDNGNTVATHTIDIDTALTNTSAGAGTVIVNNPITWAGTSNGNSTIEIEAKGNITLTSSASITGTNANAVPVSLYASSASGSSVNVTVNSVIDVAGAFIADGGTFTLASQSSDVTCLGAASVKINSDTLTPDGQPLNNASVFIEGGIVTTGGNVAVGGTTELTDNDNGHITTNGGSVLFNNTGEQILGEPINTGTNLGATPGNFTSTLGTSFVAGQDGSITTGGGNVLIATTGSDGNQIQAEINTQGGSFTMTGQAFTDQGLITDGGIIQSGAESAASCEINMTGNNATGDISGITISWQGGPGRIVSIEGAGNVGITSITGTGGLGLPISAYTTNANDAISINGAVATPGPLVAAGGSFTVAAGGSISASSVSVGTVAQTPDGLPVTTGATSISGPITTTGNVTFNGTGFTSSGAGAMDTGGGAINIAASGAVSLGASIATSGGPINVSSSTTLGTTGTNTIDSGGGNISLQGSTSVSVDSPISTSGGNFAATGGTFENSAEISDGGVDDSKPQGLNITSTSGDITINGPISWASSLSPITFSVPTAFGVELGSSITANAAEPVNFTGTPIALVGATSTITGGNITLGAISDGTSGSNPFLLIQSGGTVNLQTVGTSTLPVGQLSVVGVGSITPTIILNGDINITGDAIFTGTVSLPGNVNITSSDVDQNQTGDIEFNGKVEGPGGLTLSTLFQARINGNVGDVTPVAFLDVSTAENGLLFFSAGPAGNSGIDFPSILTPQAAVEVDIASGGNFKVNDISPNTREVGIIADIGAFGPVSINFGKGSAANSQNLYAVGENEKFTVYGSLSINANGGTVQTGDISTFQNLTIQASTIQFMGRAGQVDATTGATLDTGMDLIAGGQISLPGSAVYLINKGASGQGNLDTPVFIAQSYSTGTNVSTLASTLRSSFTIIGGLTSSVLFEAFGTEPNVSVLPIDLTPATLSVTSPHFIPPTPGVFDYPVFGAAPREQVTAGNVPVDFRVAFQPPYPGPNDQQDLKDNGVYTREPTDAELLAALGPMAVYVDIPENPRPHASDYRVVTNRLDTKRVSAYLEKCKEVFGPDPSARRTQMTTELQAAWDAYVTQNGDQPATGYGFAKFCATTPSADAANADLQQLHSVRVKIGDLGLSYKEAQVAFQYNLLYGMSANGMREGDLAAAVATSGKAY